MIWYLSADQSVEFNQTFQTSLWILDKLLWKPVQGAATVQFKLLIFQGRFFQFHMNSRKTLLVSRKM
jgi:hypothetical protein